MRFALLVTLSLSFLVGCSSFVPATVARREPLPIDRNAGILVIAKHQREAVMESLEAAGLNVTTDFKDVGYALEVRFGSRRGRRRCGTIRNVSYQLSGFGRRLLVIKGRGTIRHCEPDILEDMSRELAENMN